WELHGEARAAMRRTRQRNGAAMLANKAKHNRQPQPRAHTRRLGGKKWIENARLDRAGNARSVVPHLQADAAGAGKSGAYSDGAAHSALFDGLLGILEQIHQDLLQLPEIPFDEGHVLLLLDNEAKVVAGKCMPLEFHGAVYQFIQGNTAALRERFPGHDEQLPEHVRGAL